jgi:pyruvate kinase
MDAVAVAVENDPTYRHMIEATRATPLEAVADGIVAAARALAEATPAIKAICCFTHSGSTARRVARERPSKPILAITPFETTARRLCLTWGIDSSLTSEPIDCFASAVVSAARAAKDRRLASAEDEVVVTAGIPFNVTGTTNALRVAPCDERRILTSEPA